MHRLKSLSGALVLAAVAGTPAFPAGVTVSNGWFRSLPAQLPAAGYFELRNTGKATTALTGAHSPACGMLMLHKSSETGGMSSMADVASVEIPAGGTVRFAPAGIISCA